MVRSDRSGVIVTEKAEEDGMVWYKERERVLVSRRLVWSMGEGCKQTRLRRRRDGLLVTHSMVFCYSITYCKLSK